MKKLLIALVAALPALTAPAGLPGLNIFNHLGVGAGAGTNGISVELATPVTKFLSLRAGVSVMPDITFNADADVNLPSMNPAANMYSSTIELEGAIKRVQGQVILNVYPIPTSSFYIAAGAYFGGNELLKINGHSDELAHAASVAGSSSVIIGDYTIPVDKNGNVSGGMKVNSFRPYLGIGFGRVNPGKFLNFSMELGAQFQGKPELYTDFGSIEDSPIEDDNTFQKVQKYLKIYPTLTFRLNFRVF